MTKNLLNEAKQILQWLDVVYVIITESLSVLCRGHNKKAENQ